MSNDDEAIAQEAPDLPPTLHAMRIAPEIVAFREWAETTFSSCSDAIRKGGWDDSNLAIGFVAGMRRALRLFESHQHGEETEQ